jgi:hypothetical protein
MILTIAAIVTATKAAAAHAAVAHAAAAHAAAAHPAVAHMASKAGEGIFTGGATYFGAKGAGWVYDKFRNEWVPTPRASF